MRRLLSKIKKLSQPARIDTELYSDKMAESGRKVIRLAYEQARSRGHNQMGPEHVLLAISEIEQPIFDYVMRDLQLDSQAIKSMLETKLSRGDRGGGGIMITDSLRRVFAKSLKQARGEGRQLIESIDLFVGVFEDAENIPCEVLKRMGADRQKAVIVIEMLKEKEK